jgi:hypothetical protein
LNLGVNFGLANATLSGPRGLGGGAGEVLRTVPDTSDSFYVVVRTPDGDADAVHFERDVGSGGVGDLGNKWPEWRVTGRARLASFASDPTAPSVTFTTDPGAQDIVATSNGTVFMGSFHGLGAAGALNSETLLLDGETFDPTTVRTGNLLSVQNSTTASDGTNSFTRDLTTTIGASGGVHYKINSISKGGTISFVYLGMVIGTGAYDEADVQLTEGGAWKPLPALGTSQAVTGQIFSAVAIKGIRLRDTATGRAVQIVGSGISALANYVRSELLRLTATNRLKGYFGRFSDVAALANAEWETNASVEDTGSLEGTNLMANGGFASGDFTGWTKASGAGNATIVSGAMRQTREAAANHRMRQTSVITAAVNDILAYRMDTVAVSAGTLPIARVATANTLSSVGAMVNQTTVLGRNLFVFVASVTTIWPGDEYSAGTAGQTADTDNFALMKLN